MNVPVGIVKLEQSVKADIEIGSYPDVLLEEDSDDSSEDSSSISNSSSSPVLSLFKLPKRDIRRFYANMFTIVSNSTDMNLVEGWFKEYTTPSLLMRHDFVDQTEGQNMFQVDGRQTFLQFVFNTIQMAPDQIWKTTDMKVITYPDQDESKVEFTFELCTTRVYDIPFISAFLPALQSHKVIEDTDSNTTSYSKKRKQSSEVANYRRSNKPKITTNSSSQHDEYSTQIHDLIRASKLFPTPLDVVLRGTATMHLDANKRVVKFLMEGTEQNLFL